MPDAIENEAGRLRIAALVHLPIAADIAISHDNAAPLEMAERRALAAAALIVVPGSAARDMLARYRISHDTIVVVEPGTTPAPIARGSGGTRLQLLCVATLNPNKGYEILLEALAAAPRDCWHLTCAGSLTRHPATVDRVRAAIRRLHLEDHVTLAGELDRARLDECYDRADVFVLATRQETYGMAVRASHRRHPAAGEACRGCEAGAGEVAKLGAGCRGDERCVEPPDRS
jgi:glycosyltransferase involved in cell wall biosynthesis